MQPRNSFPQSSEAARNRAAVIAVDKNAAYPKAMEVSLKLKRDCEKELNYDRKSINNIVEQDHRG